MEIPINTFNDTSYYYLSTKYLAKKIKSPDLTKSKDSLHIIFNYENQMIDVWTVNYSTYYGFISNYTNTHLNYRDKKNKFKKRQFYFDTVNLDTAIARKINAIYNFHSVIKITSEENFEGWLAICDGKAYSIEYSTPQFYNFKSWSSPRNYR